MPGLDWIVKRGAICDRVPLFPYGMGGSINPILGRADILYTALLGKIPY